MRTSGSHSDAPLTIIPALLLLLFAAMMLGGTEPTLRAIDDYCRKSANTISGWFKSAF